MKCILFFFSILFLFHANGQMFNSKLTEDERAVIESGDFLFHSIRKIDNIRINEIPETEQVISTVQEVRPNYLAEIVQIIPYKGNENLVPVIARILSDVQSYIDIPYYSEQHDSWGTLFDDAAIIDALDENGKTVINGRFLMSPFEYYTSRIEIEDRGTYYFYKMQNTQKIKYRFLSAIRRENMVAAVSVFRYEDNWIVYGLGGADMIRLPFLSRRIEVAFINRIKSFASFIFQKLEEYRSADAEN